jgi:prenyltransferase beta subunit
MEERDRQATLKYVLSLRDAESGAFKTDANGKPSYRACNSAAKAIRYLGGTVSDKEKAAAFILKCYDPATGAFAEPGGKADVGSTAVGVIAAAEYGIPHEKYPKALDYLKAKAKAFDDVRLAAAAVEAWGVKDCPFKVDDWVEVARSHIKETAPNPADGGAREVGSAAALGLRLGIPVGNQEHKMLRDLIVAGQQEDGGWHKKGAAASDPESNYRVMRALWLMKERPNDPAKLRALIAKHRNADGGYGMEPGKPSNVNGTYFAVTILHWLAELEK